MPANHSALFWLAATLAAYVVSRVARHYVRSWWTSPLLLTCVLCLGLTIGLHAGYSEYMRGGQWLLLLLGPATVAFAVPIYEHRALIKRHWATLAVGVAVGCGLAFGGGWLLSGLLGLSQEMRLSLLPRSFTTPFAMAFAQEVGGAPDLAAVCVIATGILGASLGGMLLKVLPLRTALARGAMLGMGAHGAGVARALEAGEEEGAIAGLVMILAGVTCALIGPAISLLESQEKFYFFASGGRGPEAPGPPTWVLGGRAEGRTRAKICRPLRRRLPDQPPLSIQEALESWRTSRASSFFRYNTIADL